MTSRHLYDLPIQNATISIHVTISTLPSHSPPNRPTSHQPLTPTPPPPYAQYVEHLPWHCTCLEFYTEENVNIYRYMVILTVVDPRKCKYLKDYSLDFENAYMTTYLAL
jgi:hypothetical protein